MGNIYDNTIVVNLMYYLVSFDMIDYCTKIIHWEVRHRALNKDPYSLSYKNYNKHRVLRRKYILHDLFSAGCDEHPYQIHSIQFHTGMILDPGKS